MKSLQSRSTEFKQKTSRDRRSGFLSLAQASQYFRLSPQRKASRDQIRRWCIEGFAGVTLETIIVNGELMTNIDAIETFCWDIASCVDNFPDVLLGSKPSTS